MFNSLISNSTGHARTMTPRQASYRICLALLIVALLATLSSAASVPAPALSIVVDQTPSPLPLEELNDLSFSDDEYELRLEEQPEIRSTSSNGAVPLERGDKRKRSAKTPTPTTTQLSKSTSSPSSSPLPEPFDNTPASAFQSSGSTDSCPNFISSLLSNPTFKSCYPLSMMLQTSTGFFQAEKSLLSIVRVLDATCRPDSTSCAAFLDQAATNLTMSNNCKTEVDQNQTLVLQAYHGLLAYKTLYAATCLQNPSTSQYCFANAVTNLNTPSDAYLYFMPYGLALPGSSNPSCSWCTQQTMDIYYSASADRSELVASVYADAARQVNTLCGPNYVNGTLPPASSDALAVRPAIYTVTMATLGAAFAALVSIL